LSLSFFGAILSFANLWLYFFIREALRKRSPLSADLLKPITVIFEMSKPLMAEELRDIQQSKIQVPESWNAYRNIIKLCRIAAMDGQHNAVFELGQIAVDWWCAPQDAVAELEVWLKEKFTNVEIDQYVTSSPNLKMPVYSVSW